MKILRQFFYLIGLIFGIFSYGNYLGRKSAKSKADAMFIEDVYHAKKRQDEYDATPIAVKREWLRKYTNS